MRPPMIPLATGVATLHGHTWLACLETYAAIFTALGTALDHLIIHADVWCELSVNILMRTRYSWSYDKDKFINYDSPLLKKLRWLNGRASVFGTESCGFESHTQYTQNTTIFDFISLWTMIGLMTSYYDTGETTVKAARKRWIPYAIMSIFIWLHQFKTL